MFSNSYIFLVALAIGLLIITLILLIEVITEEFKRQSDDHLILIGLITIPIIFLIPVILGLIQDL